MTKLGMGKSITIRDKSLEDRLRHIRGIVDELARITPVDFVVSDGEFPIFISAELSHLQDLVWELIEDEYGKADGEG